jgi:hypothetical protein
MPAKPVKITRLITLGFNNAQKSPTDGPIKPSAGDAIWWLDVTDITFSSFIMASLSARHERVT